MNRKTEMNVEQKFLHDIASSISIVRLQSKRLLKICNNHQENDIEKILVKQIHDAAVSMESSYANYKSFLMDKKSHKIKSK